MTTPLEKAIELAGTQTALAHAVNVKQGHIWHWLRKGGGQVPPTKVLDVCQAVNWQLTPHDLRPDIYPNPSDGMPAGKPTSDEAA